MKESTGSRGRVKRIKVLESVSVEIASRPV